jgi:hypothetical protein
MRSTSQPLARAASTAKWGVSARTAQSTRGGSPAVSASVVVAITNACAIPFNMATLAARKRGTCPAITVVDQRRPIRSKPTCTILPRSTWTRDVPVTAARSPSCEPDHRRLDRSNQCDLSTRSSPAEGNYARLKAISTESGGSVGAISSSLANIRRRSSASSHLLDSIANLPRAKLIKTRRHGRSRISRHVV